MPGALFRSAYWTGAPGRQVAMEFKMEQRCQGLVRVDVLIYNRVAMEFKMEEQCQSCETTVSGLDQHEVAMEFKMEQRCQQSIMHRWRVCFRVEMEFKMEERCQSASVHLRSLRSSLPVRGLFCTEVPFLLRRRTRRKHARPGSSHVRRLVPKNGRKTRPGSVGRRASVGESQWSSRWRSDASAPSSMEAGPRAPCRNGVQDGGSDASRYVRRPLPGSLCVAMEFKMDERCQRG